MTGDIFEVGRNCWRVEHASRVAFLVDGAAYYAAVAEAVTAAERSILILGWDIDSRVRLVPAGTERPGDLPAELGPLLAALVRRRRRLRVHLVDWDWAIVFALGREGWPWTASGWPTSRRVRFRFDGTHPVGASHHQKVVVIDDRVAFAGGLDLCGRRWDTPEHRADDPRRVDPSGHAYDPFHDVQMVVEGDAARALGDLARERWRRLTGRRLRPPRPPSGTPWPRAVTPDLENVAVAIARTEPAYDGRTAVREVEHLYRDAIAAARRFVYIENQYLTSSVVGDALAARLREPDGPDIVIVVPTTCSGWLEEATMGVLRARLLERLRAADIHDRLRVLVPTVPGVTNSRLNVHAKVLVVDDQLVRIGSANLSNRSMGLDTECDLAVASNGDPRAARAIASLRTRLVAEHLGVEPVVVEAALARLPSPIQAIASLQGGPRSLQALDAAVPAWMESWVEAAAVLDPERTVDAGALARLMRGAGARPRPPHRRAMPLAVAFAAVTIAWGYAPLGATLQAGAAQATALAHSPLAPLLLPLLYGVAGVVMIPVTVLVVGTALVLDLAPSLAYAIVGSLLGALAGYGAGRILGRNVVRRLASGHLERLRKRLAGHGVLTVAAVRVVPAAPFAIVNLVAGAIHLKVRDFALGTTIGMLPVVVGLTLIGHHLGALWRAPSFGRLAVLGVVAAMVLAAGFGVRRHLTGGRAGRG